MNLHLRRSPQSPLLLGLPGTAKVQPSPDHEEDRTHTRHPRKNVAKAILKCFAVVGLGGRCSAGAFAGAGRLGLLLVRLKGRKRGGHVVDGRRLRWVNPRARFWSVGVHGGGEAETVVTKRLPDPVGSRADRVLVTNHPTLQDLVGVAASGILAVSIEGQVVGLHLCQGHGAAAGIWELTEGLGAGKLHSAANNLEIRRAAVPFWLRQRSIGSLSRLRSDDIASPTLVKALRQLFLLRVQGSSKNSSHTTPKPRLARVHTVGGWVGGWA